MSDPRIGGAGSVAAVAVAAKPNPPSVGAVGSADPLPLQMKEEDKDIVGDLIRTLNDTTHMRVTIAAHGSYSDTPSSYTSKSYVIETSLYGEIFYVIKIKYIKLLFTNSEQLVHLFTPYSIHSMINDYNHTSTLFDKEAIERLCEDKPELEALRVDKKAFIQKLGEYIRDLLLKGSWETLHKYMGELYNTHINHLTRLENCLTACTIYPPGSTIYSRNLTMKGSTGKREDWSGVYVNGSEDRTEEEPFDSLFLREGSITTESVIEAYDSEVYVFISCGARDTVTEGSPIEKEQNERRLEFNKSRKDSSGPEEVMLEGFDIDTVSVTIGNTLTLDMAVRTHEAQLNRDIHSRNMDMEEQNAHLSATENYDTFKNPDTSIRSDKNHPIAVLMEREGPLTFAEGTVEKDEHYVFNVKAKRVERNTLAILLEDLLVGPLLRYYIKIDHIEGEHGPKSIPSLVPVFPLLQKYLHPGTTAESFLAMIKENPVNMYIYITWIDRNAEKIFNQEDIGSFYTFVDLFTDLVNAMKVKNDYDKRVVQVYIQVDTLFAIAAKSIDAKKLVETKKLVDAKKLVEGENLVEEEISEEYKYKLNIVQEAIQETRGSQIVLTGALNNFFTRLEGQVSVLGDLREEVKKIYIETGFDYDDEIQKAIDEILDEEEGMKEKYNPVSVRAELEPKIQELEGFSKKVKAIIKSCLAQRGSSRKTMSKKNTPKRKTKKRRLKSCLTRRKGKKAQTE